MGDEKFKRILEDMEKSEKMVEILPSDDVILFYYYKYDADCCLSCNRWITKNCGDSECMYCANRPDTPLEALNIEMMMHSDGINVKEWRRDNYQHKSGGMERNVKS